jgi:hypothetical protein
VPGDQQNAHELGHVLLGQARALDLGVQEHPHEQAPRRDATSSSQ